MSGSVQTTADLLNFAQKLQKDLLSILEKGEAADRDYAQRNKDIQAEYEKQIKKIISVRDEKIDRANSVFQKESMYLNRCGRTLDVIVESLPEKYRKNYKVPKDEEIIPKEPDFTAMQKVVDEMMSGSARVNMSRILSSMPKAVSDLFDDIFSARRYLGERGKQNKRTAEEGTSDAETCSRKDIEKAETERDQALRKNESEFKTKKSTLQKEYDKTINDDRVSNFDNSVAAVYRSLGGSGQGKLTKGIIQHLAGGYGESENIWSSFSPADEPPEEIMTGFIKYSFNLPKDTHTLLKERMPFAYSSGNGIKIPYAEDVSAPFLVNIEYQSSERRTVTEGVRSILLKLLRFMPPFTYNITYVDTTERGSSLGRLHDLSDLRPSKVLRVCTSKEDASDALRDLLSFIDRTNKALAGTTLENYNSSRDAASKIPLQFVIINDCANVFDRGRDDTISALIQNARQSGISLILTSETGSNVQDIANLKEFTKITVKAVGSEIHNKKILGEFVFDEVSKEQLEFINKVKATYENIKIDNKFSSLFHNIHPEYRDANQGISIPFALNEKGKLTELRIVNPEGAHTLLSGKTGSGKSVTLHTIITSIIMNYSPDDVELWLVDYKTAEFAEYIDNMPPHVKLVCAEVGEEFTFGILDMVYTEYANRMKLFKDNGVSNLADFNRKNTGGRLPRILLIVDEFHRMTQAIRDSEKYMQVLENIMTEARASGISCVFSDQTVSVGLTGFTAKGRMQLGNRLAMMNSDSEIRETLDTDRSAFDEETRLNLSSMTVGQVAMSPRITTDTERMRLIAMYQTILTTKEDRSRVISEAKKRAGNGYNKNPIVINGTKRLPLSSAVHTIIANEGAGPKEDIIPVHVGIPATLSPYFFFEMKRKSECNIMVVGQNDDLRASILLHTMLSFKRLPDSKIYLITDRYDDLYEKYEDYFEALLDDKMTVVDTLEGLCSIVRELHSRVASREDARSGDMICWLGLEEYAEELSDLPSAPSSNEMRSVKADDVMKILGLETRRTPVPESKTDDMYNATEDISDLIKKGPKRGIFSLVSFSSVKTMKSVKFIDIEHFSRKIALKMDRDSVYDYLGTDRKVADAVGNSDEMTATYLESGTYLALFRPYLLPEAKEWVRQWEW